MNYNFISQNKTKKTILYCLIRIEGVPKSLHPSFYKIPRRKTQVSSRRATRIKENMYTQREIKCLGGVELNETTRTLTLIWIIKFSRNQNH